MDQTTLWGEERGAEAQSLTAIPSATDGSQSEAWLGGVHPDGYLEMTKGFHLQAEHLNRILAYLAGPRQRGVGLYRQISTATGLTAARVEALVQCEVYMQLLTPRSLQVTALGRLLLERDPFFDRPGSLWLLHYLLASNPLLAVWNYVCNGILPARIELTSAEAARQFSPFVGRWTEDSIHKKVPKELNALFAAYTTELFAPLGYISEIGSRTYGFRRGPLPVPPLIFLATVLAYRDRFYPGASAVGIPTLIYTENSPGRLLREGETEVRRSLDDLHDAGHVTIESKANLDQVRFRAGVTWFTAVHAYYEEATGG